MKVPWVTLYQNCSNPFAPLNKMAARAKNRKTFKRLLLLNQKMDFEIIIQECFFGDTLPKLLKRFCYVEQNGLLERPSVLVRELPTLPTRVAYSAHLRAAY